MKEIAEEPRYTPLELMQTSLTKLLLEALATAPSTRTLAKPTGGGYNVHKVPAGALLGTFDLVHEGVPLDQRCSASQVHA